MPWPVPSMVGLDSLSLAGCRLPMKRSAAKGKNSFPFQRVMLPSLAPSMAAEKANFEDDYDGM